MTYFATNQDKLKPTTPAFIAISVAFIITLVALYLTPWATQFEQSTGLNWLFNTRGEISPPKDITIVALNSSSGERMGYSRHSYTWPRTVYANLLNQLQHANVELVVLDIAFRKARDELQDSALEEALAKRKNVILYNYIKRHQIATTHGTIDIEEEIPPLERFASHALASSFFILPKTNGNIYTTPLFHELASGKEAAQPVLAYLAGQDPETQSKLWRSLTGEEFDFDIPIEAQAKKLHKLASSAIWRDIPTDVTPFFKAFALNKPMIINYYGGPHTLPHVDIDHVLEMSPAQIKRHFDNKTVYVGYLETWQTEQQDAYHTVFTDSSGVDISGVEISATVYANLRQNDYIKQASPEMGLITIIGFCLLPLLTYRLPRLANAGTQLAVIFGYLWFVYSQFAHHAFWLPLGFPLIGLLGTNCIQLCGYYSANRTRMLQIRHALTQYLPQDAAYALSQNITALEKHHKIVSGVVLMTDIKGYTSLSEKLPPEQLHTLMNRYYKGLVETVEAHNGFIGNIVGDSLMALWTASEVNDSMCKNALQCARKMQQVIQSDQEIANQLPTCIALHGGQFSLGNLGAKGHFEYSPVGDIINTSSRIEHFNRDLGTQLLVSQSIASHLNNLNDQDYCLRYLGVFNLRNKSAAVPLYTDTLSVEDTEDLFRTAVERFQQHHYQAAYDLFHRILDTIEDGPCLYYVKACEQQLGIEKPIPSTPSAHS